MRAAELRRADGAEVPAGDEAAARVIGVPVEGGAVAAEVRVTAAGARRVAAGARVVRVVTVRTTRARAATSAGVMG
jgi:hypothetical protein